MCLPETSPPLFANARSSLGRLVSISLDHLNYHLVVENVQVVTRLPVEGKLKQDAVTRRSPRYFEMFRRGWAADTEQSSLLLLRSQGCKHLCFELGCLTIVVVSTCIGDEHHGPHMVLTSHDHTPIQLHQERGSVEPKALRLRSVSLGLVQFDTDVMAKRLSVCQYSVSFVGHYL